MNKKLGLAAFGLIAFVMILQANPASAGQPMLVYHGKNVIESPPEFAGLAFHFLINNDKATVVSAGQAGLEVVRMDLVTSDACIQTQSTLCFDGTVTEVKNPQIHQVGDKISFMLDLANKKQIGTAKSGSMEGMTVTMNIARMSVKSDAPFTIEISREGGFAAFPRKTMTFDSSTGVVSVLEGESQTDIPLSDDQINEINTVFKKSNLLNMINNNYLPSEGSADYFTYRMVLNQGVFQKEFTWTDTSQNVPESLKTLQNTIWSAE